jgi:Na+/H+ antiporter NhaA
MDATKIGVIGGSLISALLGAWLMRRATPTPDDEPAATS